MIDTKLESMYDDLFGTGSRDKNNTPSISLDTEDGKTAVPENKKEKKAKSVKADTYKDKEKPPEVESYKPDLDTAAINRTIDAIFGSDNKTWDPASLIPGSNLFSSGSDFPNLNVSSGNPTGNISGNASDMPENNTSRQEDSQQASNDAQQAQAQNAGQEEEETDPMEELDSLIGLTAIKHDVKELIAYVKVQKLRSDSGLKSAPVSLHLVFTGNPGTGKTTVARIIARLYKQIGVLSQGQLVEVDRSGLVAGYVGQTAIKTQKKIEEAMGGILFIDEAYALAKEGNDFGQESIDTILKAMEDNRKDFVVIVAGYTKPMEHFIESNPGLKSRFNKYIEFADYTMEELTGIFKMYCDKYEYTIDEENLARVTDMLRIKKLETIENFANAREARNLFEKIITNQARRISSMENPSLEDMKTIAYEDLFDDTDEAYPEPVIKLDSNEPAALQPGQESAGNPDPAEPAAPQPGQESAGNPDSAEPAAPQPDRESENHD